MVAISVDALLFDLDGTLIDSRQDLADSVQYLQKAFRHRMSSDDEVASYVGDGMRKLVERALPELPAKRLPEAIHVFIRHYAVHCLDHTKPYKGIQEVLSRFRHKSLGVVTNKPWRVSKHILESLGWGNVFQSVVGGNSLRTKKPDPQTIRYALNELHVSSPRNAVMVGDGVNDVLAGRAAGTWTCGIYSTIGDPQQLLTTHPDFLILTAYELMHLFN